MQMQVTMLSSEMYLWLADNWVLGSSIFCLVCVVVHLVYSWCLVRYARGLGIDLGVSCLVPLWNVIILVRCLYRRLVGVRVYSDEEVIEL